MNFRQAFLLCALLVMSSTSSLFAYNQRNYCSGLKQCLDIRGAKCNDKSMAPVEGIDYNQDFCSYFKDIQYRGIQSHSYYGKKIYSDLGRYYRVSYPADGILPVNADMMKYLLDHVDLAAMLVNAYQGTEYKAEYRNKKHTKFWGTNGGSLEGTFVYANRKDEGRRTVIYGRGSAKVLMWKMYGVAVVFLDYYPSSEGSIEYQLDAVAFPGNSVINGIMNLGLFKKVVRSKMDEIIGDVTGAAVAYASGNLSPIIAYNPLQTPESKKMLREFQKIIDKSGWRAMTPADNTKD